MTEIDTFVKEAREKQLSDSAIRKALESEGWNKDEIDLGLSGLSVPHRQDAPSTTGTFSHTALSPLMAALHHILLWFFTASSTITIIGVIASLYGETVSVEALAAMIAVTVVTFIPYAVLFGVFLRLDYKRKGVIPGKVWSIITVCLHSIGAMIAAITLVVTTITDGSTSVLIGAALVLLLNAIVITTYCFGAFSLTHVPKFRKVVILLHLPVLVILFGILSILSVMQIGPAKHDDTLRQEMVTTVQKIHTYTGEHRKLPADGAAVVTSKEIHYTKKSDTTYELCGDFQVHKKAVTESYSASPSPIRDEYVYKDQFSYYGSADRCFLFTATALESTPPYQAPVSNTLQLN